MRVLYSIAIFFYRIAIAVAACFQRKARLWQRGRLGEFAKLRQTFETPTHPVWFHCASLGEYEQAKPLIEKVKTENPESRVLVTFFSPSGYEVGKKDTLLNYVFYLPMDFRRNARRFVKIVQPEIAIFIKYEFWFNYMTELKMHQIPFYYVSAIFRPTQYFFRPFCSWFLEQLRNASCFFVQNEESKKLLADKHISQVEVCGDTRFDRVYAISQQPYCLQNIVDFKQDKKLIVAGSTWEPDETLLKQLFPALQNNYKLLIAPHEISRKEEVLTLFKSFKTVTYTSCSVQSLTNADILVLDTVGMLSKVYKYSDLSYVGGAFRTGLHNILEPGVFGVPLFFGPHYRHFNEAVALVEAKGAFSVNSADKMLDIIQKFERDTTFYHSTCQIVHDYVLSNTGACDRIYATIYSFLATHKP